MTIGEKLTKLRREQNLTQEQFAELLHVSRQSVSKWELGTAYPETEKLIRIGKLFDVSLDYLLKDEIESMDVNLASASEDARYDKARASVLTYLSFPPLVGLVAGILSLKLQREKIHNRKQIILTAVGMAVSAALTALIIAGAIFEL